MRFNPASAMLTSSNIIINTSFPNQTSSIGGQVTYGTPTMATSVELEMKKRKILGCGTALDSVRMCTICNVACNSEEVFNKHVAGRKHAAQVSYKSVAL